jgi:hypothetical protein
MIHDLSKMREKVASLQQDLHEATRAAPPPVYQPPAVPQPPPGQVQQWPPPPPADPNALLPAPGAGAEAQVAEDGRVYMPTGQAAQQWIQDNTPQPSPAQMQMQERAELDRMKQEFVSGDSRRGPIVERLELAGQFLDMKTDILMRQTGQKPASVFELADHIERAGIGEEFRQLMPEVSREALPQFIHTVFGSSNTSRLRYASELCERVLKSEAVLPGGGVPPPAVPGDPTRPLPAQVPARVAAEGVAQPSRTGVPGKQERMDALADKQSGEPWAFSREEEATLQQLRRELGVGTV